MLIAPDVLIILDVDKETIALRASTRLDAPWKHLNLDQWKRLKDHTDLVYGLIWEGLGEKKRNSIKILKGDGSEDHIERILEFFIEHKNSISI